MFRNYAGGQTRGHAYESTAAYRVRYTLVCRSRSGFPAYRRSTGYHDPFDGFREERRHCPLRSRSRGPERGDEGTRMNRTSASKSVLGVVGGLFSIPRNRTTVVVMAMVILDAVCWLLVYTGRVPMPGMMWLMQRGIPMAAPGAMERAVFHVNTARAVVGYFLMWGVMMWAMMYPAMTRFVREYADVLRGSTLTVAATVVAFLSGYSLLWLLSAAIPLTLQVVLPGGIYGVTRAHTPLVIGGALVFTGLYQLSKFKHARLCTCCACLPAHNANISDGLRRGMNHGVSCILTCLGLFFVLMPFFGEMNFVWMVALTAVATVERLPVWGRELSIASGVVAVFAGLAVLVFQPPLPIVFTA